MYPESRKRPHADDDDTTANKKRVLISANGSPHPNGVNDEQDELTLDNLEVLRDAYSTPCPSTHQLPLQLFRKEAIFRRMRHYSRENERSQARIAQLEQRKNTCEAGYAAIVACWTQVWLIHLQHCSYRLMCYLCASSLILSAYSSNQKICPKSTLIHKVHCFLTSRIPVANPFFLQSSSTWQSTYQESHLRSLHRC